MLNKCATYLTNKLNNNINFSNEEKDIYVYGFELLLSTLLSTISIFAISLAYKNIFFFLFFILFFYSLRLFCGGFHAKTYLQCFILTNLIFVSTIVLSKVVMLINLKNIMPLLVFLGFCVIFYYAPIENGNHPYSKTKYQKFRIISRILAMVYMLIFLCVYVFVDTDIIVINASWSYIWVSLMIVIAKLKEKGGKSNACF